jgi:ferrous iron transport protein A
MYMPHRSMAILAHDGECHEETHARHCKCEPFSSILGLMAAVTLSLGAPSAQVAGPAARSPLPAARLSSLGVGSLAMVARVGSPGQLPSALERRLLELGFIAGERVEVLAEARPGRDPFVVRVGSLTLALRRREAEGIWVTAAAEGAVSPES